MLNVIPLLKRIHECEDNEEKNLLDFALERVYGGRVDINELWEAGGHEGYLSPESIQALKEVYDSTVQPPVEVGCKSAETLDPSKRVVVCDLSVVQLGITFNPPRVRTPRKHRSRVSLVRRSGKRGADLSTPSPSPEKKGKMVVNEEMSYDSSSDVKMWDAPSESSKDFADGSALQPILISYSSEEATLWLRYLLNSIFVFWHKLG